MISSKPITRQRVDKQLTALSPRLGIALSGITLSIISAGALAYMSNLRVARRGMKSPDHLGFAAQVPADNASFSPRNPRQWARPFLATANRYLRWRRTDDKVLIKRLRTKLRRVVAHAQAIEVAVQHGTVTVSGPILAHEAHVLLSWLRNLRGVTQINNRLIICPKRSQVHALQERRAPANRDSVPAYVTHPNYASAAWLLTSTAGAALLLKRLRQRARLPIALAGCGVGLLMRRVTNRRAESVVAAGDRWQGIGVRKTIDIDVPVEEAFKFCANVENFPRFMSSVLQVRMLDNNRSHWTVRGPGDVAVQWTSEITALVAHRFIEWRSIEGTAIVHWGSVRFVANENRGTRADVRLCYLPAPGTTSHVAARAFVDNLNSQISDDLKRMKRAIESVKLPCDTVIIDEQLLGNRFAPK